MSDAIFDRKLYEQADNECPICGKEFYYEEDEPDYVSEAIRFYNGTNDCFAFWVYVTCSNCGKKFCFEDGN